MTTTLKLAHTVRMAASKLEKSTRYQWGHMGACNCGYLAQEVTRLTQAEIHQRAMMRHGDWSEQLNDYCATSGLPMDDMISELVNFGFDTDDLKHLERLSNQKVLRSLPSQERNLQFNIKADVVKYMRAWATQLEDELVLNLSIPAFDLYEAEAKHEN